MYFRSLLFLPLIAFLGGCAGLASLASVNPATSSTLVTLGSSAAAETVPFLVQSNASRAFPGAELRIYQRDGDVLGPNAGRLLTWAALAFPISVEVPTGLTKSSIAMTEVRQAAADFCNGFDGLNEDWSPAFRQEGEGAETVEYGSGIERLRIESSQRGERLYVAYFACLRSEVDV